MKTSLDLLNDDHMLRAFAAKGASIALERSGNWSRADGDLAHEAAMEAVKAMSEGDAALAIMREERDRYKALALEAVNMAPRPLVIPAAPHSTPESR